jgi:hypothetical protein
MAYFVIVIFLASEIAALATNDSRKIFVVLQACSNLDGRVPRLHRQSDLSQYFHFDPAFNEIQRFFKLFSTDVM